MPKAIKKKIVKKTGLEEEEVKGAVIRSLDKIRQKKKGLIYAISALGVIIVLSIALMFYLSSTKEKAYTLEKDAYNFYYNIDLKNPLPETERWKKSLELFQKAIGIKSTPVAQFYMGNSYFNLGDYNNAIKAYLKFIDKYKSEEEMLPLVYQKLASAYIKTGKGDEAVKTLESLAKFKDGIFKDTALILEARYYESAGKNEDAMKKYKELVRDFPSSTWGAEAKAKTEMKDKPWPGQVGQENVKPAESAQPIPKPQ